MIFWTCSAIVAQSLTVARNDQRYRIFIASGSNQYQISTVLGPHMSCTFIWNTSYCVESPRVLTTPSRPCNLDRETTVNHGGTHSVEKYFTTFKLARITCYSPKQSRQNTLNYRASIFAKVTAYCKFKKVRIMNSYKWFEIFPFCTWNTVLKFQSNLDLEL